MLNNMKFPMYRTKLLAAVTSALFLLLVSAVLGYSELYIMSAAIVCVPIASYVAGKIGMRKLRCTRDALDFANEDEPFRIRLDLMHKSHFLGPVEIEDNLPEWIERQDVSAQEGDSAVSYTAIARRRGEYVIGPVRLHASDPLGFFHFRCRYPLTSKLVVLPNPLVIPDLAVAPMGMLGEYQFEGSGAKGSGIDFHGVREYQRGDDLRRVHWRSTAKHNRLNVIEFEHSRAQDAMIAIDLMRGSEVGRGLYTSLEYAVRIAAGIIEQTMESGSSARLVGDGITGTTAAFGQGIGHLHILMDALARVRADHDRSLSDVLLAELYGIRENTSVICLAEAIDEGMIPCADLLISRGMSLQFVLVNVSGEDREHELAGDLALAGASLVVVDCSTSHVEGRVRYRYAV